MGPGVIPSAMDTRQEDFGVVVMVVRSWVLTVVVGRGNAGGAISTGWLHPFRSFHLRPINPVVYRSPRREA